MAKASVKIICAVCGEEFEHSKTCPSRKDADNYEQWAKSHINTCPHCLADAHREAEMDKARKATAGIELVELTGTPKQIAWAADIRARMIAKVAELAPNESFWALVNAKSTAAWWIDNRYYADDPVAFAGRLMADND